MNNTFKIVQWGVLKFAILCKKKKLKLQKLQTLADFIMPVR